jgi:hypothetical protein
VSASEIGNAGGVSGFVRRDHTLLLDIWNLNAFKTLVIFNNHALP